MNIIEQINKGESKSLEFKETFPLGEQLSKTIIAFANMGGGKLLIGVSNEKIVTGIKYVDPSEYHDKISNIIHDTVHPLIIPDIYSLSIGDKTIIVVEVYPSPLKPHFLKSKGKGEGTYIRVGATNKKADAEYIQELERQKINISFDEDLCREISSDEFDLNEFRRILSENLKKEISINDLLNFRLLKKHEDNTSLTNSSMIITGQFEYVRIRCARFKGNEMDIFIDQKDFVGNIFEQLENAMKFLLLNINLHGELDIDYIHRKDTYEIPPEALREAVINAIVHRLCYVRL